MFVLIASQSTSMDIKVLVFVLTLVLTLESFQVFYVLLLKSQFEVFQLHDFLLIVMDGLSHTVLFTFDH